MISSAFFLPQFLACQCHCSCSFFGFVETDFSFFPIAGKKTWGLKVTEEQIADTLTNIRHKLVPESDHFSNHFFLIFKSSIFGKHQKLKFLEIFYFEFPAKNQAFLGTFCIKKQCGK